MYGKMHQWVQMVETRKRITQIVEGDSTEEREDDTIVICKDFMAAFIFLSGLDKSNPCH